MLAPATASAASLVPLAAARTRSRANRSSPPRRRAIPGSSSSNAAAGSGSSKTGRSCRNRSSPCPTSTPKSSAACSRSPSRPTTRAAASSMCSRSRRGRTNSTPKPKPARSGSSSTGARRPTRTSPTPTRPGLVFKTEHSAGNHNGGQIMFGPEGLLYITIGDNANSSNAQNVLNDFGKVLRIDPRDPPGEPTYSVPASNPTFPEDIHSALYSIGLRNPYRASFGPNGELIVADVGEGTWEEVDVGRPTGDEHATTLWGANLGWPDLRGLLPVAAAPIGPDRPGLRVPAQRRLRRDDRLRDPRRLRGPRPAADRPHRPLPLRRPLPHRPADAGPRSPGGRPQAGRNLAARRRWTAARLRRRLTRLRLRAVDRERLPGGTDAGRGDGLPAIMPPSPPSPPSGPAADRTPPGLRLSAPRRQRLRRVITVTATCDEACTLWATGWLRTSRAKASAVCTAEQPSPRMSRGNQALEPRPRRARRPGEAAADAEEARLPARGGRRAATGRASRRWSGCSHRTRAATRDS